ncbi:unnamed protein product [Rhizoctonia solani]|uniref:DNA helicase Pif1-like 2B domain-containing protein n=1 Tax=Rhizoctonia solani TaxID=456999 RepID=A0A8H3BJS8_9AGAM|nr:unnamed protein product [Rhizoctonia solani]
MQLQGDPEAEEFAHWLLEIGEGAAIQDGFEASITFSREMLVPSWDALIAAIYANLATPGQATDDLLQNATILASQHDDVNVLNDKMLNILPGNMEIIHSTDKLQFEAGIDDEETKHLTPEFLGSLISSSIPMAELKLKLGCPVMIMHNLAPANG